MNILWIIVFGFIVIIGLLILSTYFSLIKYIALSILGIGKIIVSFYIGETITNIFYIVLGVLFILFLLGDACLDLGSKPYSEYTIEKIGNIIRIEDAGWHPIKTLFSILLFSAIIVSIEVFVCSLFNGVIILTIISCIETILTVISLIQCIRFEYISR